MIIAVDGIDKDGERRGMRGKLEEPVRKHQIQQGYGERAHLRGTGRPNLSRETKFSGANGARENFSFPCSADHEQDWQPYRLMPNIDIL